MPDAVAELLQRCLATEAEERPATMQDVSEQLTEIFAHAIGAAYAYTTPKSAEMMADSLNNKGVSLLGLGREKDAAGAFDQALQVQPHNPEVTFNSGLHRWRTGGMTDQDLVNIGDTSALADPTIEYNIDEDIYLAAGAYVGFGKNPIVTDTSDVSLSAVDLASEFGTYPDTYFKSFRVYF